MIQTYLLAWNPKRWNWEQHELSQKINAVQQGERVVERWSCGRNRKIKRGDRVFLIRLSEEPRGIFGSGFVSKGVSEGPHWDDELAKIGETSLFIQFVYDSLYDPHLGPIIPREVLKNDPRLSKMHWDTQSSGVTIPKEVAHNLEQVWQEIQISAAPYLMPEEIESAEALLEGAKKLVNVNAYERNRAARLQCIQFYGSRCVVCGFDFEKIYGVIGAGFIHVHHLKPLSEVGEYYVVNPVEDLRPVCPNCHAIIHKRKNPPFTIEEVQNFLKEEHND